tara:strand:- start:108 stop:278 length:171 start_codon:yes stop_codon:yes gene_type:complete
VARNLERNVEIYLRLVGDGQLGTIIIGRGANTAPDQAVCADMYLLWLNEVDRLHDL